MKKQILSALLLCMFSVMSFAQIDKHELDDSRIIESERVSHVFLVKGTMTDGSVSLAYLVNENKEEFWLINLYLFYEVDYISKGRAFLLKTEDNETLIGAVYSYYDETRHVGVGRFGEFLHTTKVCCLISKENLDIILAKQITKIRLETDLGYDDYKPYGNKFSKAIMNCYEEICAKKAHKNNVFSDF
ncbi:MAG: hypothetical protein MJZ79_04745 [Paludibacteraceae bacterium]|nr:hypothetical protein [Paludibacteraceae bacterium]